MHYTNYFEINTPFLNPTFRIHRKQVFNLYFMYEFAKYFL
jgi:hypothetical protein